MTQKESEVFKDKHKFQDDVWGQIILNDLERDVIDTPEFQRLFRTSQLGFVDLVYQTANHTRGVHSIGACAATQLLMKHLANNVSYSGSTIKISPAEQILIRLGALLHDISHVPLSHDIEKKTHKIFYNSNRSKDELKIKSHYGHYHKHDDCEKNPLLYILLCDEDKSILARVLHQHSASFYKLLENDIEDDKDNKYKHLEGFVTKLSEIEPEIKKEWDPKRKLLPHLLFHLLIYENHSDYKKWKRKIATGFGPNDNLEWGLGPDSSREKLHDLWYQPFRHDIIGNTLCADLIDYLKRDPQRLGMNRKIELHLLNYYVLIPWKPDSEGQDDHGNTKTEDSDIKRYCCAIDLQDQKRGTTRVSLINDIFRLLDLRHEIHEKAVMHRVVHSAIAMLSRALLLLGDKKPGLKEIVRLEKSNHALQSEDTFFQHLLNICEEEKNKELHQIKEAHRILLKLIDRRVYRPLIIIPGDRVGNRFQFSGGPSDNPEKMEYNLRTLATIVDSTHYSSFLLFVSSCVEKYLQGIFDTDDNLFDYTQKIFTDTNKDNLVKQAMQLISSRVIIWTIPYKQLYKDPAVMVSLGENYLYQIDTLVTKNYNSPSEHTSAIEQMKDSIRDANSKYSALWKLYVFISDGLFYTGIYNKIKDAILGENLNSKIIQHKERLNNAQNFFIAAFKTIYQDWNDYIQKPNSIDERKEWLNRPMKEEEFKILIDLWIPFYKETKHHQEGASNSLSTVNIDHYVHGHPLQEAQGRNCRDIRYKMDYNPADKIYCKTKEEGHKLITFLENIGFKKPDKLTLLEFEHLLELFDDKVCRTYESVTNSRSLDIRDLKLLWLSGFPWPEYEGIKPEKVSRSLLKEELQQAELKLQITPPTESEIGNWLLRLADKRLKDKRVRERFDENVDSLASRIDSILKSLPQESHQEVFADLEQRFLNESRLIFNDIKEDQLIYTLNRKWRKSDDK